MKDEELAEQYADSVEGYEIKTYSISDIEQAYLAGYNKANEWHYVKNGLPDEGTYFVIWQNDKGYKEIFILKYEEDDEEELHWVDDDYEVQDEYVIAWKEIVLPELPKESE